MIKGYTAQRPAAVAVQRTAQREKQRQEERQFKSQRQVQGKSPNTTKPKAQTTTARVKNSTTKGKTKRGQDVNITRPQSDIQPQPQCQPQGFPILIPEQLRTCLMAREDVEAAVRKVFQEVQNKAEEAALQRRVYLSEAMERLNVKSRSTMWHWNERGYLLQSHDDNGHVFYPDYKIRRAERGEHPEKGGEDDE